MAEFPVKFTTIGGKEVEKQLQAILKGSTATSAQITQLARSLKTSGEDAAKFASNLGLTVRETTTAVSRFRNLQKAGFDNASSFKLLQKEIGLTADQFNRLEKELKQVDAQIEENKRQNREAAQASRTFSQTLSSFAGNVAANVVGEITSALQDFAVGTFEAGQQFEKFRSIIQNVTGSVIIADQELARITEFAATTPFQLEELVDAFIKLSNRGINPSNDALTAFGDLALSQGKSLDQFIEAILDATSGEFERLKEFGIRAKKEGDQVSLSFKGVTQSVDISAEAIEGAIVSFAKLDGVSGSIEAVAKTTEGQISNLSDSLTQLQVQIFNKLQPTINDALSSASDLLAQASEDGNEVNDVVSTLTGGAEILAQILKNALDVVGFILKPVIQLISTSVDGLLFIRDTTVEVAKSVASALEATGLDKFFLSVGKAIDFVDAGVTAAGSGFAGLTGATREYRRQLEGIQGNTKAFNDEAVNLSDRLKTATGEELKSYIALADGLSNSVDEQIKALEKKVKVVQDPQLKAEYKAEIEQLKGIKSELGEAAQAAQLRAKSSESAADKAQEEAARELEIAEEKAKEEARIAEEKAKEEERIAEENAKELERIEKDRIKTQEALQDAALQKDLRNIDIVKKAAELAANERIEAQRKIIEGLDDESDALRNQIELVNLLGDRQNIFQDSRLNQLDNELRSLQDAQGLLERLNDSETDINEKRAIREQLQRQGLDLNVTEAQLSEAVRQKEAERRDQELSALIAKQKQERIALQLSQEKERVDLRRQVAQAEIARIEAEALIVQIKLALKAQERLLAFKQMELAAKRREGATQSELIALQAEVDAAKTNLEISRTELPLAQRALEISNEQLQDAIDIREESEAIFAAQRENQQLQQAADLEVAKADIIRAAEADQFARTAENITQRDIERARQISRTAPAPAPSQFRSISAPGNVVSLSRATPQILSTPSLPSAIVPQAIPLDISPVKPALNRIEFLLTELVNAPRMGSVNSTANFYNQPNPLQTQIEFLQGQMRAARGAL